MIVCHITSVHHPLDTRIFYKECTSLARSGFEVNLVVPLDPAEKKPETPAGVRIIGVPKPRLRRQRFTSTAWQVYRAAKSINADLYHFHDPELMFVGLLLLKHGHKVIYDIHEDAPRSMLSPGRDYLPNYSKRAVGWLLERLENFSARRVTACVAATPKIAARFRSIQSGVWTINNFPILDELAEPASTAWGDRNSEIAYIGNIALARGLREMVEAMEFLPGELRTRLKLAGSFSPAECRREVVGLRGWSAVDELGFLNRKSVRQVLSQVRAGLVLFHPEPNHVEAQPNKLFEYMSAGIPVIASNFPLWRELIEGEGCGLVVDPLNSREIASAIEYVLTHDDEAEAMGRRGREAVEQRYNWSHEEKKLVTLYNSLLAGG